MEQHVFSCYRGHHWKGIVIYNAATVNLRQNIQLDKQKVFSDHCTKVKTEMFITFKEQCVFKLMEGSSKKLKGIAVWAQK